MSIPDAGRVRARTRLGLVGTFTVTRDGSPVDRPDLGSRKARVLLMLLAVERARTVSAEHIVVVLWGDAPPAGHPANVATHRQDQPRRRAHRPRGDDRRHDSRGALL